MHQVKPEPSNTQLNNSWRWGLLLLITIGSMVLTLSQPPIAQDPAYHLFADSRSVFGIPNTFNVLSNLPFLVVGIRAIRLCRGPQVKSQRSAWLIFFSAATLISIGSAVYHWSPTDSSLAWDRLPMAISFMSLLIAILGEYISKRLANILLAPAILLGISSILYWRLSGDLRLYAWVQFFPLLFLPLLLLLFNSRTRRHGLLLAAVTCYLLAKLSELFDSELFNLTRNVISGHSLKHLLAAAGLYALVMRLKQKKGHNDSQTWPPWQTKRKFSDWQWRNTAIRQGPAMLITAHLPRESVMVLVKKLILDVLKPHVPNVLELAKAIAEQGEDYHVTFVVKEVDEKTETVEILIEGEDIQFNAIEETIHALGASLHSVDEVEVVNCPTPT